MITKRRTSDDEDDLSLFLGSLPTPPRTESEETDELGRAIPQANSPVARRDRLAARQARRLRRRATKLASQEDDGFSTDSSLPPSEIAPSVSSSAREPESIDTQNLKDIIMADMSATPAIEDDSIMLGESLLFFLRIRA